MAENKRILRIVAALCALPFLLLHPTDPDLGWHLLGGSLILDHGSLPTVDPINTFATNWLDYHWLAQLVMASVYRAGGYDLLRVFFCAVIMVLFVVTADIAVLAHRTGPRHRALLLVSTLAAIYLLGTIVHLRPQVFSLLIVALALRRLLQQPTKWELPYLFVLSAVCVNMHVYWVFIPFLWAVFRCGARLRGVEYSPLYVWGGAFLLSAAAFVSPYGLVSGEPLSAPLVLRNYALIYDYMNIPSALRITVGEFRNPFFFGGLTAVLLVVSAVAMLRYLSLRRWRSLDLYLGLAVVGFALACGAIKFVAIFALFALPLFASMRIKRLERAERRFFARVPFPVASLLLAALLVGDELSMLSARNDKPENSYPIEACQKLASLKLTPTNGRNHVRLLTHFDDGGWCRWAIYQSDPSLDYRVTTDNRTQGVPGDEYKQSFDLYTVRYAWRRTLAEWNPDVVIVHGAQPLSQVLQLARQQWVMIDRGENFWVFAPVGGAAASAAASLGSNTSSPVP